MDSREILAAINQIAATSSKNEKEALVKKHVADDDFCRVLQYAYDPFKTYGIRKMPIGKAHDGYKMFDVATWALLDDLISRKLTGTAAQECLAAEIDALDEDSAELLRRIVRKDLRAGFSESTCNKAKKGLIPDFPYMRCSLPKDVKLNEWPWATGGISQEKADGMFANLDNEESGVVRLTSRQGSPFPMEAFERLAEEARNVLIAGTQSHGELLVYREGEGILPREIGNGILNSVLKGGQFGENEFPIFMIWDQIPLSAVQTKGSYKMPYIKRLAGIMSQLKGSPTTCIKLIETRVVKSIGQAYAHAAELMKKGKEGTIVKHPNAIWKDGTSKEQVKIKLEFDVDLKVTAIVPGREGTKNEGRAGSLTCETSDGLLRVDVTVKNEAMRDEVDANPDDWIGRVITVVANDIMEPSESNPLHSLFLPRMKEACYRLDKTVADDLERVIAAKDAAIYGEAVMKKAA